MLYVNYSRPEPKPEVEAKVRAELKQWDELLDIKWFENIYYNERQKTFEGRYALICQWPSTDKRWEMYRNGEIGEPNDLLGWFTTDMHDASSVPLDPDGIWNKVAELLDSADNAKVDWRLRMKQRAEKNRKLQEDRRKSFLENEVHDLASHFRNQGLGIQQIAVPITVEK